jgi:hypothetical protein
METFYTLKRHRPKQNSLSKHAGSAPIGTRPKKSIRRRGNGLVGALLRAMRISFREILEAFAQRRITMKFVSLLTAGVMMLVTSTAWGGAVGGPHAQCDVVSGFDSKWYAVTFRAGQLATIEVTGGIDLELYVHGTNKSFFDARHTGRSVVTFVPLNTGTFYIEVKNCGPNASVYWVETN